MRYDVYIDGELVGQVDEETPEDCARAAEVAFPEPDAPLPLEPERIRIREGVQLRRAR